MGRLSIFLRLSPILLVAACGSDPDDAGGNFKPGTPLVAAHVDGGPAADTTSSGAAVTQQKDDGNYGGAAF
jgi:hypothetical protein